MLKVQLACKNITKAVTVGKADWVAKALSDVGAWEVVCKVLDENQAMCLVDEKVAEGLALGLGLGAKENSQELVKVLCQTASVLERYVSPSWSAGTVVALLQGCVKAAPLQDVTPCINLALKVASLIGKNHLKVIFKRATDADLLQPILEKGWVSVASALLFSSTIEWFTMLKPKIEDSEVKALVAALEDSTGSWEQMLSLSKESNRSKKEAESKETDGEATWAKRRDFCAGLFTVLAQKIPLVDHHVALAGFQAAVGSENIVATHRMFAILVKVNLDATKGPIAAEGLQGLLSLLDVVKEYESQPDLLFNNGVGLGVFQAVSRHVARALEGGLPEDCAGLVLAIAQRLLRMYHKIVEEDLKFFMRAALSEASAKTDVAKQFMQSCFEVYAQMQGLGVVVEAMLDGLGGASLPKSAGWVLSMLEKHLPSLIDNTEVLDLVLTKHNGDHSVLEHTASGLKVDDTNAVNSATWVDKVMSKVLLSAAVGVSSAKPPSRTSISSALRTYLAVQDVLDRASPCFLTSDIFKWSARSVQAFLLTTSPTSSKKAGELPVLLFPQQELTVTLDEVEAACSGALTDSKNSDVRSAVVRLLHQRLMRILKHKAILSCEAGLAADVEKMTKQAKVYSEKLLELAAFKGPHRVHIEKDLPILSMHAGKSSLTAYASFVLQHTKVKMPTPDQSLTESSLWFLDANTNARYFSEATWESPRLSTAILTAASNCFMPKPAEARLMNIAAAWLLSAPLPLLSGNNELLNCLAAAESKEADAPLKVVLREVMAHVGCVNKEWCSNYTKKNLKKQAEQVADDSPLAAPTLRLVRTCLRNTAPMQCLDAIPSGTTLFCQLVKGLALLGVAGGGGDLLDVSGVQELLRGRKGKKRKLDDEDGKGTESAPALLPVEPNSECALIAGASLLVLRESQMLTPEVAQARWEKGLSPGGSKRDTPAHAWFHSVCLETCTDVLPSDAQPRFLIEILKTIAPASHPVSSKWRVYDAHHDLVTSSLLAKIKDLPEKGRVPVLHEMLKNKAHITCVTAFVLTCPGLYQVVGKKLNDMVFSGLLDIQQLATKGGAISKGEDTRLRALCGLASACCLMEKFTMGKTMLLVVMTLPKMLLSAQHFERRFPLVMNIVNNVILHGVKEVAAFSGSLVHAVGDVVEAFLAWQESKFVSVIQPDIEEASTLVRTIELLAGTKRRQDLTPQDRASIASHASVMLQRFLASVVEHPTAANIHNRDLARAFSAIMALCGKSTFSTTYSQIPQNCRVAASAFHLQWEATRYQGKT